MRPLYLSIILIFFIVSCKYAPMVKYFNDQKQTNLPRFKKKNFFAGEMNSHRTAYDITIYDWFVSIDPATESLSGTMTITYDVAHEENMILIDLQRKLKVKDITSTHSLAEWKHKGDLIYVYFNSPLPSGTSQKISIEYSGKPAIVAKEGPIQWKEDKDGNPWISTQTEGVGAHYMMPCKELLYDEPEKCFIRVEVPDPLYVVANGRLDNIESNGNKSTYHWSVSNPINIYNISFNIGHYAKATKPYTDVKGNEREIEIYALKRDIEEASAFYEQAIMHMTELEALFGVFPWWNDGCKIVQTTLGNSAMEHQSAISMGSSFWYDYTPPDTLHTNTTLIHELAHEWWGNSITGMDYCDMWLHEGLATYAEGLVIERIYGKRYYDHFVKRYLTRYIQNERPILKTCGVRYNSWVSGKDGDIYPKGAALLHTLRRELDNDPLFFKILKQAQVDLAKSNISTDQFIAYFNKTSGKDFSKVFDVYLNQLTIPELAYEYDSINQKVEYKWNNKTGLDLNLKLKLRDGNKVIPLTADGTWKTIKVSGKEAPEFHPGDFGYLRLIDISDK